MLYSVRALARLLDGSLPPASELFERLSSVGLEGEALRTIRKGLRGIVAVRIEAVESLAGTSLVACRIHDGKAGQTVVSADTSLRAGEIVAWARPGTTVGEAEITVQTFAGRESVGMLVSRGEVGVGGDRSAVWRVDAPEGAPVAELVDDDTVLDLAVTPNRGDWLSHLGLARECAALLGLRLALPPVADLGPDRGDLTIELDDRDCPLYVGVAVELAGAPRSTPAFIEETLGRAGLRCIDPIVDLTNFVLLELGQPLHAFDRDRLNGALRVRSARVGEHLRTLDAVDRELCGAELVIADDSGVVALAGIMGGAASAVTSATRRILLESAHFLPARVARSRRPHGLSTEASQRFERGVDPSGVERAASRFLHLLAEICDYSVLAVKRVGKVPKPRTVTWNRKRAQNILGALPDEATCSRMLRDLGFTAVRPGSARLIVPPWRFDVRNIEDLAEEVARLWGYERFEPTLPRLVITPPEPPGAEWLRAELINRAVTLGCAQAIHLSFSAEAGAGVVTVANPLGEQTRSLRTNLTDGLLAAAARNHARQQPDVRLIEVGKVFSAHGPGVTEHWRMGLVLTGAADPWAWSDRRTVDLYDLKGLLERIVAGFCGAATIRLIPWPAPPAPFHPVRAARVMLADRDIGSLAEIDPDHAAERGLTAPCAVTEIDISSLTALPMDIRYREIPRFPRSDRDLAFVVPRALRSDELLRTVRAAGGAHLESVAVFDVYTGRGMEPGTVSLALRLRFRHSDRTLTQTEVDEAVSKIVRAVETEHGGRLRS